MDSNTTPRRMIRGILAATLAIIAGTGLAACRSATVAPIPEPAVYNDQLVDQERVQQSTDRMRERFAGRTADRIDEALAREARIAVCRRAS